jgi:hypothetical protein
VASIILKWNKFGSTKTLPRAGHPAKSVEKGIDQIGDQAGLYGRVARQKPLLGKRHMTAPLEFAKRYIKDSRTM